MLSDNAALGCAVVMRGCATLLATLNDVNNVTSYVAAHGASMSFIYSMFSE
jgi:hypothetical protein